MYTEEKSQDPYRATSEDCFGCVEYFSKSSTEPEFSRALPGFTASKKTYVTKHMMHGRIHVKY